MTSRRSFFLASVASALALFQRTFAFGGRGRSGGSGKVEKIRPTAARQVEGLITMSKSEDGLWTYVTMPPQGKHRALSFAFALQFEEPNYWPFNFEEQGQLQY